MDERYLEMAELTQQAEIKEGIHRASLYKRLSPKGKCHYCGESIEEDAENKIFCGAECAEDYSTEQEILFKTGRN